MHAITNVDSPFTPKKFANTELDQTEKDPDLCFAMRRKDAKKAT